LLNAFEISSEAQRHLFLDRLLQSVTLRSAFDGRTPDEIQIAEQWGIHLNYLIRRAHRGRS
jgi:hypothetical protein